MNLCLSGVMVFIHPERVLREADGVHCGEAPRAAASFNHALQRTAGSRPGWQSEGLARLSLSLGR